MSTNSTRRAFLQTSAVGGLSALAGQFGFLSRLPRVSATEAQVKPEMVRFDDHIEPLVRLIEETPRDRLLEEMASKIHQGTSYQEVLAALLLAGVRNVQPKPAVGFKFHAVLVVNSCHIASLAGPDEDRWLPIFWALDHFKSSQADEASKSGWHMPAVKKSKVPDATQARKLFIEAMDRWDEEQADVATAGLARTAGATEVFNLFATYAARDFRAIGHKAIFLANAWRTLQVIGWEYAEPVLRSLATAFLNHGDEPNPSQSDLSADRPWRQHAELMSTIPANWLDGKLDPDASRELMSTQRIGTAEDAASVATQMLAQGLSPQSVWDGVFVGAGELLMRQPGIVGLHGLTTANAMHFLWSNVAEDDLRRRLLLQACSFNALFRDAAQGRAELKSINVDDIQPLTSTNVNLGTVVPEVLSWISSDRTKAAARLLAYLQTEGGDAYQFIDAARQMIFLKGRDSHDYKFSSAVLEDYAHVSPAWRNQFLALSVFNLKGSLDKDNGLVERTRAALS